MCLIKSREIDHFFLFLSLFLSDDVKFWSLTSPKFQDVRDLSWHSDECHVPGESGVTESRIAYNLRGIVPVTKRGMTEWHSFLLTGNE